MLTDVLVYTGVTTGIEKFVQQAGIALSQCRVGSLHAFVLIDLILYVPVNNFSVMSGRVFLG